MAKVKTRSTTSHSVFGAPLSELSFSQLPTHDTVARHFLFLKDSRYKSNKEIAPILCKKLIAIWDKANIPTQSSRAVTRKIIRLMESGSKQSKNKKTKMALSSIFDICSCICSQLDRCKCRKPVPSRERHFLCDQRSERKLFIGNVDKKVTMQLFRRSCREKKLDQRLEKTKNAVPISFSQDSSLNHEENTTASDENYIPPKETASSNFNTIDRIALEADRYGVSNRAAAAIATATLVDFNIISGNSTENIIDHHKIWRARKRQRKLLSETTDPNEEISAIFFDGRKDSTLVKQKVDEKWYSKKITEDHYVLVGEPGTTYLQHCTVSRGTGREISDVLVNFVQKSGIEQSLFAVGADSTAVNTGCHSGAISLLEQYLGMPLHWIICHLHLNELPLRHLCQKFIGESDGPGLIKGEVGKALNKCEEMPISENGFCPIESHFQLPIIDEDLLSHDQLYLYQIISAIKSNIVSDDLLRKKPGPMSKARWITTANRICRYYVSISNPSESLRMVVDFIINFYGPMWFRIKLFNKFENGANLFLEQMNFLKSFPQPVIDVVWPVLKRNSYWAHSENVFLSLLADSDIANRKFAVQKILAIRTNRLLQDSDEVRQFLVPKADFNTTDLKGFLKDQPHCFEPPITRKLSKNQLEEFIQRPFSSLIPCHSQGVERSIKLVTEASSSVYGAEARDGFIKARLKSRDLLPTFETKSDFLSSLD